MKLYLSVNSLDSPTSKLNPITSNLRACNYKSDMITVEVKESGLEVEELSLQKAFVDRLKDICKSRELNLKDVAKHLKYSPTTFSKILNNSDRSGMHLTMFDLFDIVDFLNLSIVLEEKSIKIIEKV